MQNNRTTTSESSENTKPREKACHHERHVTGVVLKVYNLVWRMQKKFGGSVNFSNQRIAKMIHAGSPQHVSRAKTTLVRISLFRYLGKSRNSETGSWNGGRYQAVAHNEWAEMKAKELGHSPCHPDPLQAKVSSVHPGGKNFQSKRSKAEACTVEQGEGHTAACPSQCSEVAGEGHTAHVLQRTHRPCPSKDTQSVDLTPSVDFPSALPPLGGAGAQPRIKRAAEHDAVRRPPEDAELRPASEPEILGGTFPPSTLPEEKPSGRKGLKRKEKLHGRLVNAIRNGGNEVGDRELDPEEAAALKAAKYNPRDPQSLSDGFLWAMEEEYGKHHDVSPGILCCKVIDHCMSEIEACKTLGDDPSDYYYPPDFVEHRDRVRAEERESEQRGGKAMAQAHPQTVVPESRQKPPQYAVKRAEGQTVKPAKGQTAEPQKESHSEPTAAPALSYGDQLRQECDKELMKLGIGPELYSDPSVSQFRDIFVMAPSRSFKRRMADLREDARLYRFTINPKLLKAQREEVAA